MIRRLAVSVFEEYSKKRDFLVCIDSDGCAMDTMDCKHFYCFGPCMIHEWKLEQWEKEILDYWNQVNLYTMTRGINRFLGLSKVLTYVNETYCTIPQIEILSAWSAQAKELSNAAVKAMYEQTGEEIYQKALSWSLAVNESITKLSDDLKKPFDGAPEGVKCAHRYADVAIVSSANLEAVREEWEKFGLMDSVDICLTQNEGSKAFCIGEMLKAGYEPGHVLMVGDAPGDRAAASKNGVLYYPILVRKEAESWRRFTREALAKFLEGSYAGEYEEARIAEFEENLS